MKTRPAHTFFREATMAAVALPYWQPLGGNGRRIKDVQAFAEGQMR
jgi:hypothetical protein